VDLREPENPTPPDDAQALTLPDASVMDTMVLLKVLLMCTTPVLTLRFSRLRDLRGAAAASGAAGGVAAGVAAAAGAAGAGVVAGVADTSDIYFLTAAFLLATVFFGPLRVRALVWVRWPRTGRPLRWRVPW
jgi:hypothetical protein